MDRVSVVMRFTGKLTQADLDDLRKLIRSRFYWLKLIAANWYGAALFLAVVWATVSGLLGQTKPNWSAVMIIWIIIVAILSWSISRTKRMRMRELKEINAAPPDQVNLTSDGVKWNGPTGGTGFLPWRNFKGWREGRRVLLIEQREGSSAIILLVAHLSEIERQPIRQFLQFHIPSMP